MLTLEARGTRDGLQGGREKTGDAAGGDRRRRWRWKGVEVEEMEKNGGVVVVVCR
jgi:hypothetical protein